MKLLGQFASPELADEARKQLRGIIDALDDGYYDSHDREVEIGFPVDRLTREYSPWSYRARCGWHENDHVIAWVRSSGSFIAIYPDGYLIAAGRRHSLEEIVPWILLDAAWDPRGECLVGKDGNTVLYAHAMASERMDAHPFRPAPGALPGRPRGDGDGA
jgi:hypothetical protein